MARAPGTSSRMAPAFAFVMIGRSEPDKPLLRTLSFAFKPVFRANHRWAMQRGEESLRLELARRRACSPDQLAGIPTPPQASRFSGVLLCTLCAALVLAGSACAIAVFRSPVTR